MYAFLLKVQSLFRACLWYPDKMSFEMFYVCLCAGVLKVQTLHRTSNKALPFISQLAFLYYFAYRFTEITCQDGSVIVTLNFLAGLFKVQSLLRASNKTIDMSVIARQADLANMRAVLKEAKHNYWTHIIAELNITETEVLLKMVGDITSILFSYFCPENKTKCIMFQKKKKKKKKKKKPRVLYSYSYRRLYT